MGRLLKLEHVLAQTPSGTEQSRGRRSGQLHGPVIVAVVTVRIMQPPTHDVIDVVTMRNRFMPTGRTVLVCAVGLRRAMDGIGRVDRDDMLVDMVLMHVVEAAYGENSWSRLSLQRWWLTLGPPNLFAQESVHGLEDRVGKLLVHGELSARQRNASNAGNGGERLHFRA